MALRFLSVLLLAPLAANAGDSTVRECAWDADPWELRLTIGAENDPAAVTGKLTTRLVLPLACDNPDCLPDAAMRPRLVSGVVEQQLYWDRGSESAHYYGDLLVGRQPAELVVNGATGSAVLTIGMGGGERIEFSRFDGCTDPTVPVAEPKAGAQM